MTTIYFTATSVDGFIADEHNSLDWLFEVPRSGDDTDGFAGFFDRIGAFAMGATTYEWIVDHEDLLDQPDKWQDWYGAVPAWVFTHRNLPAIPGADIRFVHGEVAPVHTDMEAAAGYSDIWLVGGGDLVGAFADAGLLDEIHLDVQPVMLGAGAQLLPRRLTSTDLTLRSVERNGQTVNLVYAVERRAGA